MSQQQKPAPHYTYADYAEWPDEPRCELIDGEPVMMSPAPNRRHQQISGALFNQIYNFLSGHPCEVYAAPFDVRLNAATHDDTVVQPDLLVVCDKAKLRDGKTCQGPPDLVIEILSPSTVDHDRYTKAQRYRDAGVPEYWIVDPQAPQDQSLTVLLLKNKAYVPTTYASADQVPVKTLPGLTIDLTRVFPDADTP